MTNKKAQANDPQVANVEELVQQMQEAGLALPEDIGIWTPEQIVVWADELGFQADKGNDVMDLIEDHANDQRDLAIQQGTDMIAKTKTFNLKKAQFNTDTDEYGMPDNRGELAQDLEPDPWEDGLMDNDTGDKWGNHAEFKEWLDQQADRATAASIIGGKIPEAYAQSLNDAFEQYYEGDITDEEKLQIASRVFEILPDENKILEADPAEGIIDAEYTQVSAFVKEMDGQIKKLAQQDAKKSFNLTKTAQHKGAVDNMFMYGPSETRIDPFLRQPISDYHIVERNKGFGLVVDDIWNIDWETMWRGNIMDKYSRPYKDKDGNWTGGYIQKRFEVDKWIPEENNMQLKPGQLRNPYIAKERSTESRLEAMRAENDRGYEPASSGKPYNWSKEASSKKKKLTEAQLKEPRKPPGSSYIDGPAPTKPKATCQMCGSNLSFPLPSVCPNCKADTTHMEIGGVTPRQPAKPGKQFNPYKDEGIFIQKNAPLARAANTKKAQLDEKKEKPKKKKKKKERLGDYKSDEFKMCKDEVMYSDGKNYDDKEVEKSCTDLAIDG